MIPPYIVFYMTLSTLAVSLYLSYQLGRFAYPRIKSGFTWLKDRLKNIKIKPRVETTPPLVINEEFIKIYLDTQPILNHTFETRLPRLEKKLNEMSERLTSLEKEKNEIIALRNRVGSLQNDMAAVKKVTSGLEKQIDIAIKAYQEMTIKSQTKSTEPTKPAEPTEPKGYELQTAIKVFEYSRDNLDGTCSLSKLEPVFRKDKVAQILRDFEVRNDNGHPYPVIGLDKNYVLVPPNGRTPRALVELNDYIEMNPK